MPATSFMCSVEQGFNFQKDVQDSVGHLDYLKIGDKEMEVDLAVTDPEDLAGDKVKVVGIMSHISWNGGFADPIQFNCQVSNVNKKTLAVLTNTELSDTKVEFSFTIFDYDPDEKKYFPAFHTNNVKLKGLVEKAGGSLSIEIELESSSPVVSPLNFDLMLGVMPEDSEQETHIAFSLKDKVVKRWGVTVG